MDAPSTPVICISHHARCTSPSQRSPRHPSYSPSSTRPMSIPRKNHDQAPPPPLPPPRNIEELGIIGGIQELGWSFNNTNWQGFDSARPATTSRRKSSASPDQDGKVERPGLDPTRRGSSTTTITASDTTRPALETSRTPTEDSMPTSGRSPNYR